jgi:hypothetical protein
LRAIYLIASEFQQKMYRTDTYLSPSALLLVSCELHEYTDHDYFIEYSLPKAYFHAQSVIIGIQMLTNQQIHLGIIAEMS